MARRIRAHDWARTPLGPVEGWPPSLRTAVDMVLAMPGPATVLWGPAHVQLYNDAYVAIARDRHPALLGRPAAEGWPDAYAEVIAPLLETTRAGRATQLAGFRVTLRGPGGGWEERVFDTAWSPVRDESGTVAGALQTPVEVTDRHRAEARLRASEERQAARLRASEERQAFLLRLSDALRPLGDPGGVKETASRLLGEQLGVDRAAYAELLPDGEHMVTADGYVRPGVSSVAGTYRVAEFGRFFRDVQAGSTGVIEDAETDPSVASYGSTWGLLGIRAAIAHPVVKEGRLTAAFYVHSIPPRRWSEADVALVAEVGERTWDAVERARAEAALRESEGRHAFLVRLGDALRPLRGAAEIQAAAARLLGEHLGAGRVAYVEVSGDEYVIACDYTDGIPSMAGRYPAASFGPGKLAECRAGRTRVVHDTRADPHNAAPDTASFAAVGVRAGIGVPLVKEGVFVANLVVHMDVPRNWTPEEVALVEETADRTWAAVERARAEAGRLESDARLRALAHASSDAFYIMSPDMSEVRELSGGDFIADTTSPSRAWLQDYIPPEDHARILVAIREAIRTKGVFEIEHRVHRVDGEVGWAVSRAVPILGRNGEILEWFGAASDITARKRAEAALRESEARLTLAFRTLPVGIAVVDAAGETVMANDEMRRFLPTGRIPSRDPGRSARWRGWDADGRIVRPEDFPGARALRGEVVSPGMQMLYRDDGGAEIWTEVLSRPLRGADERINGAITVVIDVNRIKRSEEAARASEERLRQFGEASQDILWIRDADTLQWTYLTPAFGAIYGLSREEALTGDNYRVWQDLIVPEDRAHAVASIGRVAAGERVTFEYRIHRPADGEVRWLRNTDFPMRDEAGRVARIGGVGHDVTALKAMQAAMADSETRLRTLTEGIPQLVWRSCGKGLWTWCSPQWMAFTGQSQGESHGLGWLDAVHPDDHAAAMQAWEEARPHGRLDVEYRVRRASDGAWLWHRTRSVPVRDASGPEGAEGRILEWLGTTTDIDGLKRLQGQQQVLVAELQHRTRNLLAVVRNVARRSIGPSPERDEYDARLAAIGRVQGFLSRSPGYSVPLGDVVEAELHAAGDGASDKVEVVGPPVDLPGESVQAVALALHELGTNAVKYGAIGQPSGRLTVTWSIEARDGSRRLVIDWRESGVAMPDEPPARRGYGSELITRALPYQLRAETSLEFAPDGVRCRIILPAGAFSSRTEQEFA